MYLSQTQCDLLRVICDRFEVVLRSCVADVLLTELGNVRMDEVLDTIASSKGSDFSLPLYGERFPAKAMALRKTNFLDRLGRAQDSCRTQNIVEGDVPTVGELIDLIMLFYNGGLSDLHRRFSSVEQFMSHLSNYHWVRNALAHPGSAHITRAQAELVMNLIDKLLLEIGPAYFWSCPRDEIRRQVVEFTYEIKQQCPVRHNLDGVPRQHSQLLLREDEMSALHRLVVGDTSIGRVSGSVELHGWGGVGKTAIALEFCYELIRKQMSGLVQGYEFVLWLSAKEEELSHQRLTGDLFIKRLEPVYQGAADVVRHLKDLLGLDESLSGQSLREKLSLTKGLVVLDNFETLTEVEKQGVGRLIRDLPREVQIILTSRSFDGITEDDILVTGFSKDVGKQFVEAYCEARSFVLGTPGREIDDFVELACGNALIMVLGMDRIIDGTASFSSLTNELRGTRDTEVEILAEFMYKNTFSAALEELKTLGHKVDPKALLTTMYVYGEAIDFHSLIDLLAIEDARDLDEVLKRLTLKYVIQRVEAQYQLHEFAEKFVILRVLPDSLQMQEMKERIRQYKTSIQKDITALLKDMDEDPQLKPILDDWKQETDADLIAIAKAYAEYSRALLVLRREFLSEARMSALVREVIKAFAQVHYRSHHPYITFQEARTLSLLASGKYARVMSGKTRGYAQARMTAAYEDTYQAITLDFRHLARTESYAAFLWVYGIHLVRVNQIPQAVRILEESCDCFGRLRNPRSPENAAKSLGSLAHAYCLSFLRGGRPLADRYLDRAKSSIYEARRIWSQIGVPIGEADDRQLSLLTLFGDVRLGVQRAAYITQQLKRMEPIPAYLQEIANDIRSQAFLLSHRP